MLKTYTYPRFAYSRPPELAVASAAQTERRHPVVIVGAGPVGLAVAADCAIHGIPVVLVDEDDTVSTGSRGICYAKRTLEVLDRLGCGDAACRKGVSWNVGRTFFHEREVYRFNLQPEPDYKRPGMINLQQYYLEEIQVARAAELGVDLRWKSRVVSVEAGSDRVVLEVQTPEGSYRMTADWLIAADGARSAIRGMLGLEVEGRVFQDRFLIADVAMKADYPAERWFWFDPPFHPGQSVLLHKQADNVWRIDFQLGWQADPEVEKRPDRVIPRIQAMLGAEREFDLEWVSIYTFQCRRMQRFNHGRVLFAGDAAHQLSPFGARGANSGYQDADNLVWKLKLVMDGRAPPALLDSYSEERGLAADENILNSTRSTDFITPKSAVSRTFRNAVLALAGQQPFARRLVNSGRLSVPAHYVDSPLNTDDRDDFAACALVPGSPAEDAPIAAGGRPGWLIDRLGNRFQLLVFADDPARIGAGTARGFAALSEASIPVEVLVLGRRDGEVSGVTVLHDSRGLAANRYDGADGTAYLMRPDQHVAARWRRFDPDLVRQGLARATRNA